ncbi:hypothetical protein Pan54_28280 [Rubinisphaera italica]|uniref:Uncharacterized protein n=1 Tax=Rubinisphaera italica TaxID=2527969 RepID=A0A5C5XHB2_9PLAN|nr:hypothetical protein Pan54_28280 [Rubinisphaera italica]
MVVESFLVILLSPIAVGLSILAAIFRKGATIHMVAIRRSQSGHEA